MSGSSIGILGAAHWTLLLAAAAGIALSAEASTSSGSATSSSASAVAASAAGSSAATSGSSPATSSANAPASRASGARRAVRDPGHDEAALQALVGDAACRDDTQCRTLPVGSLACGGPASYLPWSTLRSDEAALKAAAAPLAQRRPGSARGEVSICRVLPDPGARCVRDGADGALGTCRLRERGDARGGGLPTR
jgi:hypothetical protein